jgi:anti-anti-sigma factor
VVTVFSVHVERIDVGRAVVHVAGAVDIASAVAFHQILLDADSTRPDEIVVDMASMTFLDCAGVATVMAVRGRMMARGGRLRVRNARRLVKRVLEVTGVAAGLGLPPDLARVG